MSTIRIIEAKSEVGAGTRGSSLGPDALRTAAHDFRSDYFNKYAYDEVADSNEHLFDPPGSPFAKRIDAIVSSCEQLSKHVSSAIKRGEFPIILSADHSNAIGTVSGLKAATPKKRLGVIWVDAHADLHSPLTTPSGNVHGMPLAALLGADNRRHKRNNPDKTTLNHWDALKNLNNINPKVDPRDIVFLTLRDYEPEESAFISEHQIKVYTTAQIRNGGINYMSKQVLNYLDACDHIYISFDVDALDPTVSKGTGTPVKGGLLEREMANLLLGLLARENVACFEITEVNPTLDSENMMAETAFSILQKVTNEIR